MESPGDTLFELAVVKKLKILGLRWNIDDIYHTFGDISTSGFGGHIAISGYPSSSKLLALKSPW